MVIKSKILGYLTGFVIGAFLIIISILERNLLYTGGGFADLGQNLVKTDIYYLLEFLGILILVVEFVMGVIDLIKSKRKIVIKKV